MSSVRPVFALHPSSVCPVFVQIPSSICMQVMTQAPENEPTQSVGSNYALSGVFNAENPTHHTHLQVLVTPCQHSVSL
jgi:uncharacterized lipoprotein YajG